MIENDKSSRESTLRWVITRSSIQLAIILPPDAGGRACLCCGTTHPATNLAHPDPAAQHAVRRY
jgi:hypothetical protein